MKMEAGGPSSKRSRSVMPGVGEDEVGADRISDLPDDPLHKIISLLPIRDGARTQILASRWRHLWRSAPLNLDCNDLDYLLASSDEVAGVISDILSSHLAPARRFCVPHYVVRYRPDIIDAWLRSPALDKLEELDLLWGSEGHPFPASIGRLSTTLRVFFFGWCCLSDNTVQRLHFHKLKQLKLHQVSISETSLNRMIAGCPALEQLVIRHSFGFRCVRINSRTLRVIGVAVECSDPTNILCGELIIENAPYLKRLFHLDDWEDEIVLRVLVISAPQLETLCGVSGENQLSTKLLTSSTVIQGVHADSLTIVLCSVKILALQMKHLDLDIVIELMRCFPCLQTLYIQPVRYSGRKKNLWRRKYRNPVGCLDFCLKTIVLTSYQGIQSDVNFATFFVLNAKGLESMTFEVVAKDEDFIAEQHRKKLQLEKRASRGAQFHFTTHSCLHIRGIQSDALDVTDPFLR